MMTRQKLAWSLLDNRSRSAGNIAFLRSLNSLQQSCKLVEQVSRSHYPLVDLAERAKRRKRDVRKGATCCIACISPRVRRRSNVSGEKGGKNRGWAISERYEMFFFSFERKKKESSRSRQLWKQTVNLGARPAV